MRRRPAGASLGRGYKPGYRTTGGGQLLPKSTKPVVLLEIERARLWRKYELATVPEEKIRWFRAYCETY